MHKYIALVLLLTLSMHSAQQKRLISGKWSIISISGIYKKKNSIDNNTFPSTGRGDTSTASVLIDDMVDFNSSNNDIYSLLRNSFDFKNMDKYDSTPFLNSRIDAHRMAGGKWESYSTKNLASSSNDFTKFEVGKSYWIKATSTKPENNISIIIDNYIDLLAQYSLRAGWNFIALNDDIFEHTASAFFIPSTELSFTISRQFNLSPISINEANIVDVAKAINHKSFLAKINGEPLHLRAYPANKIDGATNTEGIIVVSDSIMNINALNAISLNGERLQSNASGSKISNIEHIISFKLNSSLSVAYKSMLEVRDLNGKSGTLPFHNNIRNMTNEAVAKGKEVLETDNVVGYNVMLDFNQSTPIYDNILIASDKSFGISEKFYARKFKYLRDGSFFVSGADAQRLNTPSDINRFSNATGITYHNLGDSKFEISSHYRSDLDLFKNDTKDLFEKIDNDNKGYATGVCKSINLYGAYVQDNNISPSIGVANNGFISRMNCIKDLTSRAFYSESINKYRNLQKFFLLQKRITNLYTAEYSSGSLYWRTIDLTKKSKWFDRYDKANLFVNNKELAYYAYLQDTRLTAPVISDINAQVKVSSHFNTKNTYNLASYKISFKVSNLAPDKRYIGYMLVSEKVIQLYGKNGLFEVELDSEFLKLEENKKNPVSIKIANNNGALVFNKSISLLFNKPTIKSAKITGNTLDVQSDDDYEIYSTKINEINKKETFLGKNITDLSKLEKLKEIDYQNIKVVALDKYGFYSNIHHLGYIPDNNESTLRKDNERRNGITLKIVNDSKMTLSFTPIDETKLTITLAKIMYLKVDFRVIGSVAYDIAHKNNKFFVSYGDKRYEGIFQNNDDYSSDTTAYKLTLIE